jgi:hypothetical protein
MAEQKRLSVSTGHAANGCNEGSRPDIIAVEDTIAGGLEATVVKPVREMRGLDKILQLMVLPSRTISLSLYTGPVTLAVSVQAVLVFKDVVNPLLKVVKNEQPILFAYGLSDLLETRGAKNLNDLNIPYPDEAGDSVCQSRCIK